MNALCFKFSFLTYWLINRNICGWTLTNEVFALLQAYDDSYLDRVPRLVVLLDFLMIFDLLVFFPSYVQRKRERVWGWGGGGAAWERQTHIWTDRQTGEGGGHVGERDREGVCVFVYVCMRSCVCVCVFMCAHTYMCMCACVCCPCVDQC